MTTELEVIFEEEIPLSLTSNNNLELDNKEDAELVDIILDLSQDLPNRIQSLDQYHAEHQENTLEVINRLISMYRMSGIENLSLYLMQICTHSQVSSSLKLHVVKSLTEYQELIDEENDSLDEIKGIKERNNFRKSQTGIALNHVCYDLEDFSSPCRVEAINLLMTYPQYKIDANNYFIEFINDDSIECEFRYKAILGLENLAKKDLQEKLLDLFKINKDFVRFFLENQAAHIKREFPKFMPDQDNYDFFELLVHRLSYNDTKILCTQFLPQNECIYHYFLYNAQLTFLFHLPNMVYYKILASQYLLQKCSLILEEKNNIEHTLLGFATDEELDYDRRADAADVLLQLGSEEMKHYGRTIIRELGQVDGGVATIFNNAQNVHIKEVEKSVIEILEFFATFPTHIINGTPIEFAYIEAQITNILKKEKDPDAVIPTEREKKIYLALNRIHMDRALYSKFNNTLDNILIKIWSYIRDHECEDELRKRLLEELEEMAGTCSTGFVSRLINVVSGFGLFNIRISWEDQIIANFSGRLNACVRSIMTEDSIFRTRKLNDMVGLWLNDSEQKDIRTNLINNILIQKDLENVPKMDNIVEDFLLENRVHKIEICLEHFSVQVITEMSISSSTLDARQYFALFLRSNVAAIREEMYAEFKEHLDDTSFDLYMRKALMHYEGELY